MNDLIAPQTIMAKTSVSGRLILPISVALEEMISRQRMQAMSAEIDDVMTGGHKRLARQAEWAREQMAAERLRRGAQAVLDKVLVGAGSVWAIVKTIDYDMSTSDEVQAVFTSEDAAKAALALLTGMSGLSISEFPLIAG